MALVVPVSEFPSVLSQVVDLLPSGAPGVLLFFGPAALAVSWLIWMLARRKASIIEVVALVAFWSLLILFNVPLFVAEQRVLEREREFQRRSNANQHSPIELLPKNSD